MRQMINFYPQLFLSYSTPCMCMFESDNGAIKVEIEIFCISTECPKKMSIKPIFEFQTRVSLGVKNNSNNFGNNKIVGSLANF